jgi:hypothetical protein
VVEEKENSNKKENSIIFRLIVSSFSPTNEKRNKHFISSKHQKANSSRVNKNTSIILFLRQLQNLKTKPSTFNSCSIIR